MQLSFYYLTPVSNERLISKIEFTVLFRITRQLLLSANRRANSYLSTGGTSDALSFLKQSNSDKCFNAMSIECSSTTGTKVEQGLLLKRSDLTSYFLRDPFITRSFSLRVIHASKACFIVIIFKGYYTHIHTESYNYIMLILVLQRIEVPFSHIFILYFVIVT